MGGGCGRAGATTQNQHPNGPDLAFGQAELTTFLTTFLTAIKADRVRG
ncbi:hypothetical protein [Goodfellowiella coeruleoviolacea]|nr:hypothetical protein [Goodfellowiella coeruleoviolacea]